MRRSIGIALIALAQAICVAALVAPGCNVNGYPELKYFPDAGGAGGGSQVDANVDDASDEDPPPPTDGGDGGPTPVYLGITPTPAAASPTGPTKGEQVSAMLTAIAAGARSAVITRSWKQVSDNGLADVADEMAFYKQHKTRVLFNLAFVDRNQDARPADVAQLPWDDPAVSAALDGVTDQVLTEIGEGIDILTFGRDVDVFLGAHPGGSAPILALAAHACQHAHETAAAPPKLRVAVAGSFGGFAAQPDVIKAIAGIGDVFALSYIPGQTGELAAPTTEVANHLDQMIAAASAANKPIVLQAVGYPSEPFMQSSSAKQQLFFDAFFAALLPRRSSFLWVNIYELHDRWPDACAAYAEAQGEAEDGGIASFACSLGLFTQAGEQKPAWDEVLEGAATFASP